PEHTPDENMYCYGCTCKSIDHAKKGPGNQRQSQPEFGSYFVNYPTGQDCHGCIGHGKNGGYIRIIRVCPSKPTIRYPAAKKRFEITDDLPVHIVDGSSKEEKGCNRPPVIDTVVFEIFH